MAPLQGLDSVEAEVALFRAVIKHRPVGSSRHFSMLGVCRSLQDDLGRPVAPAEVWRALGRSYDLEGLDEMDEADSDLLGLATANGEEEEEGDDDASSTAWAEFQLPIHPAISREESFLELVDRRRLRSPGAPGSPPASEDKLKVSSLDASSSPGGRSLLSAHRRARSVRSVSSVGTGRDTAGGAGGDDSDLTEQEGDEDEEGATPSRRTRSRPSTGSARGRGRARGKGGRGRRKKVSPSSDPGSPLLLDTDGRQ